MSPPHRVVVTGLGLVTALGHDETTVWTRLRTGQGGIRALQRESLASHEVQNGGTVDPSFLDGKLPPALRRADVCLRFAHYATQEALHSANLASPTTGEAIPTRDIGCLWGCGAGQTEVLQEAHRRFFEKGPASLRPSTIPNGMANALSAQLSIAFGLTGPNYVIASACTSSTNALGVAFRMLRAGDAEAVLCGGADTPFNPFHYACWANLGVLSTIPEAHRALRPFAADRAGTLLGEGAGALVLETLDHAQRRGAVIRGEIVGYGESSDATHITGPSAAGQAKAIRAALASATVRADQLGYINAHATGTDANDASESEAIIQALGSAGLEIPVGATKPYFGHTLGASGAIEVIGTLLAMEQRLLPPTLNDEPRDPACRLALIGSTPLPFTGEYALKTSFGFGGGNAALVLRRFSPA